MKDWRDSLGSKPKPREIKEVVYIGSDIIHFEIEKNGIKHYLCNHACNTTSTKLTKERDQVTCKNCLRELEKEKENAE